VLLRNLLSCWSHRAERMEAAWAGRRLERKLRHGRWPSDAATVQKRRLSGSASATDREDVTFAWT
jgi:hypothetical protein